MLLQTPLCTMEGHSNAVSAVCWPDVLAIYTGSHDHSIKHWDPEATQCVRTWVCATLTCDSISSHFLSRPHIQCKIYLPVKFDLGFLLQHAKQVITDVKFSLVNNMIATSHNDKLVRIWDPRSKGMQLFCSLQFAFTYNVVFDHFSHSDILSRHRWRGDQTFARIASAVGFFCRVVVY